MIRYFLHKKLRMSAFYLCYILYRAYMDIHIPSVEKSGRPAGIVLWMASDQQKASWMWCMTGRKQVRSVQRNFRATYGETLLKGILLKERGRSQTTCITRWSGSCEADFHSESEKALPKSESKDQNYSSLRRTMCCAVVWDFVRTKLSPCNNLHGKIKIQSSESFWTEPCLEDA
jgi:hypothetical protein